jgi:hypothetical protein
MFESWRESVQDEIAHLSSSRPPVQPSEVPKFHSRAAAESHLKLLESEKLICEGMAKRIEVKLSLLRRIGEDIETYCAIDGEAPAEIDEALTTLMKRFHQRIVGQRVTGGVIGPDLAVIPDSAELADQKADGLNHRQPDGQSERALPAPVPEPDADQTADINVGDALEHLRLVPGDPQCGER